MSPSAAAPARARHDVRAEVAGPRSLPSGPGRPHDLGGGASVLAEAFGGQQAAAEPDGWGSAPAFVPPVQLATASGGGPPRARGAGFRRISQQSASARGPLLDLQRLAGNAAVAQALMRTEPASVEGGGRRDTAAQRDATGSRDAAAPVQRIEIPGLGDIDISGYISRALSILGPAEETRDQARTDARKQADDATTATDAQVESGNQQLDTGKSEAEHAGEAGVSEAQAHSEDAAAAGVEQAEAGKAHGDHVAEEIKGMEGSVEGLVDPLAEETGSVEGDAGHQAIETAAAHAVQPAESVERPVPGGPGMETSPSHAVPAGAEPAVSHGPGPPGPEPGSRGGGAPAPTPEAEHAPAQAGPGESHHAPDASPVGEQAPAAPGPGHTPASVVPGAQPAAPAGGGPEAKPPVSSGGAIGTAPAGGAVGTTAPTCALAEAAKTVAGWREKIQSFATGAVVAVGKFQIPVLDITVGELAGKARKAAKSVKDAVSGIKNKAVTWAKGKAAGIKKRISDAVVTTKRGFDTAVTTVKGMIKTARDVVSGLWDGAKTGVSTVMQGIRAGAARLVGAAVGRVRSFIAGLPQPIQALLGTVGNRIRALIGGDPLGDAADYLRSKLRAVTDGVRRAKEGAAKIVTAVEDSIVKGAASKLREAKTIAKGVVDAAKTVAPYVLGATAPGAVAVAGAAGTAAAKWGKDLRDGADRVGKAIKGEACEAIGETVGPCLDMYLPKPDNKEKGFARLSGQADITVPLHEVDVPCNVKMGRGASVSVERSPTGYSVAVDGDALIFANLATGKKGTKTEVKAELPTGGMATVWEHLGGAPSATPGGAPGGTPGAAPGGTPGAAAPAPAAPATTAPAGAGPGAPTSGPGQAPSNTGAPGAAPGGSGPDLSGEVEGGLKGSANLKFSFPTAGATTCEGAGGVASLLGALGVAAGLPAPLDMLARSGVVGSWEGNLVSNTVTMAVAGGVQVELSEEGIGALKGQGQAEVYVTTGVERPDQSKPAGAPSTAGGAGATGGADKNLTGPYGTPAAGSDPNALRPVLKVGTAVKGEAAGELVAPGLLVAKGGISSSGRIEALLLYDRPLDQISLQSITASGEVGVSVGGINPALVAAQLKAPIGPAAAAAITRHGLAHSNGSIKASVASKANNLQKYINAVDTYLGGSSSSVSAAGLAAAVRGVYSASDFSTSVQVTATVSDRAGLEGKVEDIEDEGAKLGGSAKASIEVGKEYQLYP